VGGSAVSTFNWWQQDTRHIATAYLIGRRGTVYEVFEPERWAYHLGLKDTNRQYDKSSIGIELTSVGPLTWYDGGYYQFGKVSQGTRYDGKVFDITRVIKDKCTWRGWRFFAEYTGEQVEALRLLLEMLSKEFSIELTYPGSMVEVLDKVPDSGVYAHSHVRKDKSDVHLGFDWGVIG